ncbi:hypothetical protein HELRODRAFT_166840 [Helobdella robusta]|uniref:Uncharacterized protein n=1 Tax=Helobdella robusta TaxID=6412 RepID=T1EYL9_HELRO|nr:hypothetical protein HELRODRAFT_166840 [Helobdella robusta]ESO11795.1 hypothetical protein HELRODRAFT_166840 [Helobdella robusta]
MKLLTKTTMKFFKIFENSDNNSYNDFDATFTNNSISDNSDEMKIWRCINIEISDVSEDDFKINDGFIADEDEICIAASLIDKKDVNKESYNMHLSYLSGYSTPRKLKRKKAPASSANRIKKRPRRLPMARRTKTT